MAIETKPREPLPPDRSELVVDVVQALQPRLKDLPEASLRRLVQSALDEMGDVRVTTYLSILVERKVRDELRQVHHEDVIRLPA